MDVQLGDSFVDQRSILTFSLVGFERTGIGIHANLQLAGGTLDVQVGDILVDQRSSNQFKIVQFSLIGVGIDAQLQLIQV